ncbi:class I SAM-dependent methyltransferase [Flaviflagellibacter deserti]|uniref:Class I SAM-dependent methyltransferase n=1 Tax=Flaviflagellibacter deserti TaxID=2267266 RepID=A0ABV9YXF9_9HYPH
MNAVLTELLSTHSVTAPSGRIFQTTVGVSREDASFISDIINADPEIVRTLEVGCALGFSSLAICESTKARSGAHHTIVDPFQVSGWEELGVFHLRKAGLDHFELVTEGSEFALPRLAKQMPESLDLVFIDGDHTFEYTLVDLFFSDRLVRKGGYILVDDASWHTVARAIYEYLVGNKKYRFHARHAGRRAPAKAMLANAARPMATKGILRHLPDAVATKLMAVDLGDMVAFQKTG